MFEQSLTKTDRGSEFYKILLAMKETELEITKEDAFEILKIVCNYQDNAGLMENVMNIIQPILSKDNKEVETDVQE